MDNRNNVLYANFDIVIQQWNGKEYPTHVIGSPAGEVRGTLSFTHLAPDMLNTLRHLRNVVLHDPLSHTALRQRSHQARELGGILFDALMSAETRTCFDVSRHLCPGGLRIRLRIDPPELATLPWELMSDRRNEQGFLALSMLTPIVRYFELRRAIQPLPAQYPLNIMVVIANPASLAQALDVEEEAAQIMRALQTLNDAGFVSITLLKHADLLTIQRCLREKEFHVFHFVGHGHYSIEEGEGHIVLENSDGSPNLVSGRVLGWLLHDEKSLRLAVLNACTTGESTEADAFPSVASAIIQAGVPAVVAMQSQISDRAANKFAQTFYEALADSYPIDAATAEGRRALFFTDHHGVEWAIPQLFMRSPDGLLFALPQTRRRIYEPVSPPTPEGKSERVAPEKCVPVETPHAPQNPPMAGMVRIPAGEFIYGQGERRYLAEYDIDIHPVTNQQYLQFMRATGAPPPASWKNQQFPVDRSRHPVSGVSWLEAQKYAAWAGKRLPTQEEWEKASRGVDGRRYPWGNAQNVRRCNVLESGNGRIVAVGEYADDQSPYGIRDLIGNVWEWTADEEQARGVGKDKTKRIVRGGAFNSPGARIDCTAQSRFWPEEKVENVGFRCACSISTS